MGGKTPVECRADAFYFHQVYYCGFGTAQKGAFRQLSLYLVQPSPNLESLAFRVGKYPLVNRFKIVNITNVYTVEPPVNTAAQSLSRAFRKEADTLHLLCTSIHSIITCSFSLLSTLLTMVQQFFLALLHLWFSEL